MTKLYVSPQSVASALLRASEAAIIAAGYMRNEENETQIFRAARRSVHEYRADSMMALEEAYVALAHGVRRLTHLRRRDPRFDFGVIHQQLLDVLPRMIVADPADIDSDRVEKMAKQLDEIARYVLSIIAPAPKPLDLHMPRTSPSDPGSKD